MVPKTLVFFPPAAGAGPTTPEHLDPGWCGIGRFVAFITQVLHWRCSLAKAFSSCALRLCGVTASSSLAAQDLKRSFNFTTSNREHNSRATQKATTCSQI